MSIPPENTSEQIEYVFYEVPRRRNPLARLGCGLLLVIWLLVLLLPGFLIFLAIEGEFTWLYDRSIPEYRQHPRLQVSLVSEIDYRGLSFRTSSIHRQDDLNMCLQTNVSFLLWQGEGPSATYCDCYTRSDPQAEEWMSVSTVTGACD